MSNFNPNDGDQRVFRLPTLFLHTPEIAANFVKIRNIEAGYRSESSSNNEDNDADDTGNQSMIEDISSSGAEDNDADDTGNQSMIEDVNSSGAEDNASTYEDSEKYAKKVMNDSGNGTFIEDVNAFVDEDPASENEENDQ